MVGVQWLSSCDVKRSWLNTVAASSPTSHLKFMVLLPTNKEPTTPLRISPRFACGPPTASPLATEMKVAKANNERAPRLSAEPHPCFSACCCPRVRERGKPKSEPQNPVSRAPLRTFCKSCTFFLSFYGSTADVNDTCVVAVFVGSSTAQCTTTLRTDDLAPSRSKLPVEHLAFSPDPSFPPKVLFPEVCKRKAKAKAGEGDVLGRNVCCNTRCDTTESCSSNRRQAHLSQSLNNTKLSYRL